MPKKKKRRAWGSNRLAAANAALAEAESTSHGNGHGEEPIVIAGEARLGPPGGLGQAIEQVRAALAPLDAAMRRKVVRAASVMLK